MDIETSIELPELLLKSLSNNRGTFQTPAKCEWTVFGVNHVILSPNIETFFFIKINNFRKTFQISSNGNEIANH